MKPIILLSWSFVLGQVVGYLGSQLTSTVYSFWPTTIMSLITGLIIMGIAEVALPSEKKNEEKELKQ